MSQVLADGRPKITDWITGIATVILVIITSVYVLLTHSMLGQSRIQLAVSQDPVITIMPADDVQGEIGEFQLSLRNGGLSSVTDIRIFEDYFVSMTPKGGPIRLTRFGLFSTNPNSVIPALDRNEDAEFKISFKAIHEDMKALYNGDAAGHRMMIARLTIKYDRVPDGRQFSTSKAFIIAGHGDALLDYDERGMASPGAPSFADIKTVLGVSE